MTMRRQSILVFDMNKVGDHINVTMNAIKQKSPNSNETHSSERERRTFPNLHGLLEPIVVKVSQDAEMGYNKSAALAAELSTKVATWPFQDLYAFLRKNHIVLQKNEPETWNNIPLPIQGILKEIIQFNNL
jgi:hypothetical protein